ncbi:MAG: DUF559 domain-containing protein [Prevotella sp.]|nr:DUF559 domain-containing protein [Prevotella sp.]
MNEKKFVFETAEETSYDLLKQYANENKMFMTDAERLLWNLLKAKGIGYKFRRQHIIGEYIADFANLHYKLVVEVDGKYHFKGDQPVADDIRTSDLNKMGYTVIRFTNDEVLNNIHQVEWQIKNVIKKMEISYPKKETSVTPAKSKPSAGSTPSLPGGAGWASDFVWPAAVNRNSWAVDAACSGNPGPMEYQAIDLTTGAQVFHFGPLYGTNNIGEFLAIVHALALMDKQGIKDKVIYSDSYNAILWVKKKQCKTKLERTPETEQLYQIITRAEQWLRTHNITIPVMKWETKAWGEVPADFGRK